MPSGGGYATARGMVAFYQMLGHGGRLGDVRQFSPRLISYVSRNHTGEMGDHQMDGIPMAWWTGSTRARRKRTYSRPWHHRRTRHVWSWRSRNVLLVGSIRPVAYRSRI